MQVTIISLGSNQEQFAFLNPLIEMLQKAGENDTIYFPDIGIAREAEITCEQVMQYDDNYNELPTGVFTFSSPAADSRMMYEVEVQSAEIKSNVPGQAPAKALRMTMRMMKNARQRYYNSTSSIKRSYNCVFQQIRNNFAVGAAYRKIVPIVHSKKKQKEAA